MEESSKKVHINDEPVQDQQNDRVAELLQQYARNRDRDKGDDGQGQQRSESRQQVGKYNHLLQNGWRKWLCKKGKGYLVDFDQRERRKLKDFFNTLDRKKCGYISLDQFEEMLLGLGLAEGFEDVKKLIGNVDLDHSGRI